MNLMELFIKIGVNDQASSKVETLSKKLGNGLKSAAKIGVAAVAAASTAVVGLATSAIKSYAEYEQLVGGVETLFKKNASVVQGYAEQAYKTANMSANKYMETVTSFSASLLQGLGGDTAKAAEYADMAVRDMSDNANKFGTDISMIQNAYQGFAKRNYTMLDNLKLGYGGTASEMARLINDSGVLGDTVTVTASNINRVSFDKIVEAINVVQTQMGITGTTAKEASTTIQGSINTMKGAWENLKVAMVSDTDDIDQRIDEFVESVGTVGENLLPRVEKVLSSVPALVDNLGPRIIEKLPGLLETITPDVLSTAGNLVKSLANTLFESGDDLIETGLDLGLDALEGIGKAVSSSDGQKEISNFLVDTVDAITNEAKIARFTDATLAIVEGIFAAVSDPDVVLAIGKGAFSIVFQIGAAIGNELVRENPYEDLGNDLANSLLDATNDSLNNSNKYDAIIQSLKNGISEKWLDFQDWLLKIAEEESEPVAGVVLGKNEVEAGTNFGGNYQSGYEQISAQEAWKDLERRKSSMTEEEYIQALREYAEKYGLPVNGSHARGLPFVPFDGYIAELHKGERVLTAKEAKNYNQGVVGATINITINGAQYNSEESIAEAVAYKIQQMINGRGAAYA